jgi:hypothetical protein
MKECLVLIMRSKQERNKKENPVWKRVDIIISLEGNELEFEVLEKVDSAFSLEHL